MDTAASSSTHPVDAKAFAQEFGLHYPIPTSMEPLGIKPPSKARMTLYIPRKLFYGFPIPFEWFHQQRKLANKALSIGTMMSDATQILPLICHEICPDRRDRMIAMRLVHTGNYYLPERRCWMLVVGTPAFPPEAEEVMKWADALEEYGLVEHPTWYPSAER